MTLPTEIRRKLKKRYKPAFSFALTIKPDVIIVDFMRFIKVLPDDLRIKSWVIKYFVDRVKDLLYDTASSVRFVIVMVDGKPIPVKKMVAHVDRYKAGVYASKQVNQVYPKDDNEVMPLDWNKFSGNYKLLRRALYPDLFNALLNVVPLPGQELILSGFPGRTIWTIAEEGERPWELKPSATQQKVRVILPWRQHELPIPKELEKADPDLYHRTFVIRTEPTGIIRKYEWEDAKCDISESDIRIFFFDHWFQQSNILIVGNDGDFITIANLYAEERRQTNDPNEKDMLFRNNHIISLPYLSKGPDEPLEEMDENDKQHFLHGGSPKDQYIYMNEFHRLVAKDKDLCKTQHPHLALAFLVIMSKTDFFMDVCKGIGADKGIWPVFLDNIPVFRALVQQAMGVVPNTRTERRIQMDELAFEHFIHLIYLNSHAKGKDMTYEELKHKTQHTAKGVYKEDTDYHLPERNTIRKWARQVLWNLLYWKNGPLGYFPSPFEMWDGVPYYPYWKDPKTGKFEMTDMVSASAKPVQAIFAQNMRGNHMKQAKREREEENPREEHEKKLKVINKYGNVG